MFKIYSKGCEYALRILSQIPPNKTNHKYSAVELCRKAKVPIHSTRKVLQFLSDKGYLEAVSGPGGGYRVKRNPQNVSLLDLIYDIDGKEIFDRCVMGLPQCGSKAPCPVHFIWLKVKSQLIAEMSKKKLSHLISESKE